MSLPSWARMGATVVCVDDVAMTGRPLLARIPPVGTECIIDGYGRDPVTDEHTLIIRGWPNVWISDSHDLGWRVARFRPLISLEDDLATHFHQFLTIRNPQSEDA